MSLLAGSNATKIRYQVVFFSIFYSHFLSGEKQVIAQGFVYYNLTIYMYYTHPEKWYEGGGTPTVPGDGTGASPKRGKQRGIGGEADSHNR